ncbi:MAG: hypothetical protein RIQ56_327 [Candidatus Parcubacteria bacterium]|jgi:alpha-beta hydrolase superfamily lysophospholipase
MRPAHIVEIATPKKYILNGIWLGPAKAARVFIWVHGLGSSAFSKHAIAEKLIDTQTAVLLFNNRGHDAVARVSRILKNGKSKSELAGAAHEKFTDCVDDIQGAIDFAKANGARDIYLIGHSTGCQKSVYYASFHSDTKLKGIVLLAPVSDYAGMLKRHGKKKLDKLVSLARSLVRKGGENEYIPRSLWGEELDDAQRFLSLYTPESKEEIFCYAQKGKRPKTLEKVNIPILLLWAEHEEFSDRPAGEILAWFDAHIRVNHEMHVIPGVTHGFKEGEAAVSQRILNWVNSAK